MKARLFIAAIAVTAAPLLSAQKVAEESQPDPVLAAIQEFNKRDAAKPNEVTVVLDPVGIPPAPVNEQPKSAAPPVAAIEPPAAVLVTGKPPHDTGPPNKAKEVAQQIETAPDDSPKPENGLAVRVEKLQAGKGAIDPAQVKLLAPFPAKPLSQPPSGWHLDASDSAPPFTREVEIAAGSKITLTIRPHLLIPDADGANVFTISEPGYDKSLGYQQTATVGAIMSNSIRQLDEDSKQLGRAIENLQQLLLSLPKPEPKPGLAPEAKPTTIRKR